MIQITNDVGKFFKEYIEPIYIYGIGNSSYWVSYYMRKCQIEWEGYIATETNDNVCDVFGKKIIHPSRLNGQIRKIRIIITDNKVAEDIDKLHWYADHNTILCLVPLYKDYIRRIKIYDINKQLSYFRNKQLKCISPSFISNSCNAGFAYRILGIKRASPTINTAISPKDFIKLCRNLDEYLGYEMEFSHWTLFNGERRPVGKVKDIEIVFAHSDNAQESVLYWNRKKETVNRNELIYIMSDDVASVPYQLVKEFSQFPVKHMVVLRNGVYTNMKGLLFATNSNTGHFHMRNYALENWFDLLGWVNGEFEF